MIFLSRDSGKPNPIHSYGETQLSPRGGSGGPVSHEELGKHSRGGKSGVR